MFIRLHSCEDCPNIEPIEIECLCSLCAGVTHYHRRNFRLVFPSESHQLTLWPTTNAFWSSVRKLEKHKTRFCKALMLFKFESQSALKYEQRSNRDGQVARFFVVRYRVRIERVPVNQSRIPCPHRTAAEFANYCRDPNPSAVESQPA